MTVLLIEAVSYNGLEKEEQQPEAQKMDERRFVIEMHTPLGVRHGTMRVCVAQDVISGYLDLMNHEEPFSGKIDGDGYCEFSGKIITLLRTIPYHAAGRIADHRISLDLSGERNRFHLAGIETSEKA